MKAYLVSHGEGPAKTWGWIEAESPAQIEAAFRDLVIHEPPPDWATASLMEDFGSYSLNGPFDPWLERLRSRKINS
jgi:hypothetical protein